MTASTNAFALFVIAVIRAPSKEMLPDIAQALVAGGVMGIEVTMSTPKAIDGIEMLADAMGDKIAVGVGTILDAATAADAIHAGAQFVVSPAFFTSTPPVGVSLICGSGASTSLK